MKFLIEVAECQEEEMKQNAEWVNEKGGSVFITENWQEGIRILSMEVVEDEQHPEAEREEGRQHSVRPEEDA